VSFMGDAQNVEINGKILNVFCCIVMERDVGGINEFNLYRFQRYLLPVCLYYTHGIHR